MQLRHCRLREGEGQRRRPKLEMGEEVAHFFASVKKKPMNRTGLLISMICLVSLGVYGAVLARSLDESACNRIALR